MNKIFEGEKPALQVSQDEQIYRQTVYQKEKIEPGQKAVDILEEAIDSVLKTLGVNTKDNAGISQQMDDLGIIMTENTDERAPQLNGFFIFKSTKAIDIFTSPDIEPYAWVGSARLDSDGRCFCDIHWFNEAKLSEIGGEKLIK